MTGTITKAQATASQTKMSATRTILARDCSRVSSIFFISVPTFSNRPGMNYRSRNPNRYCCCCCYRRTSSPNKNAGSIIEWSSLIPSLSLLPLSPSLSLSQRIAICFALSVWFRLVRTSRVNCSAFSIKNMNWWISGPRCNWNSNWNSNRQKLKYWKYRSVQLIKVQTSFAFWLISSGCSKTVSIKTICRCKREDVQARGRLFCRMIVRPSDVFVKWFLWSKSSSPSFC